MSGLVTFTVMTASDAMAIQRQPSQASQVGLIVDVMTYEMAAALAEAEGETWAMRRTRDDALLAIFGLRETFPERQAVAWAILSAGIGTAHLAMTRFARNRIVNSKLRRIEAIVRTPRERAWAVAVGLSYKCNLEAFGGASELHFLYQRIRADG